MADYEAGFAADAAVAEFNSRIAQLRERTLAARAAMGSATATSVSRDGAVVVTASASGEVTGIEFGRAAGSLDLAGLAAETVRTLKQARLAAMQRAQDAVADVVGPGDPVVAALDAPIAELRDSLTESMPEVRASTAAVRRVEWDDETDEVVIRRGY